MVYSIETNKDHKIIWSNESKYHLTDYIKYLTLKTGKELIINPLTGVSLGSDIIARDCWTIEEAIKDLYEQLGFDYEGELDFD